MAKMWTVVKFRDEDAVEAVPSKWILNNQCYWPPFSKEKLITAIKKNEEPNTHWPLHDIVPLRNSSYGMHITCSPALVLLNLFTIFFAEIGFC